MQKEASETVQSLLKKRLVPRITKVYLRKTSKETLLYRWVNQRHPSDINSSFGLHQRGMSIGRASDWHVRNTWIDDQNDKTNLRTICNKRPRSTFAITEGRLQMSLTPCCLNEDVAQMVGRSLCMREVRRLMSRLSNFSEEPGNQKRKYGEQFC